MRYGHSRERILGPTIITAMILGMMACGDGSREKRKERCGVAPEFATASLPDGLEESPYWQQIATVGGKNPLDYIVYAGALPPGLSLNETTGLISGPPPTSSFGDYSFTIQICDSCSTPQCATKSFQIHVDTTCQPVAITDPSLPDGGEGDFYTHCVPTSGGVSPLSWSLDPVSGPLPAGLDMDASGCITGTPQVGSAGVYPITLSVADSCPRGSSSDSISTSLTVRCDPVGITTLGLPDALEGAAYSDCLAFTGGSAPLRWYISAGDLPPGLDLDPATGCIEGTPDPGTGTPSGQRYDFTIDVIDSCPIGATTDSRAFSISVGCQDDSYEENDTFFDSFDISDYATYDGIWLSGTPNGMPVLTSGDEDWYEFRARGACQPGVPAWKVTVSFSHALGNIDLEVYDALGGLIGSSQSLDDGEEVIGCDYTGAPKYLRVYLAEPDRCNRYDLMWDGN